ncbi:hypothetical protein HMPREF1624_00005 [Sporothrix schenckii ATCC 58251]|uniref:ASST-domain-containing protein n=1 Tax=Sporothrix schenckii (strain ATCC 58251 / de Perez 2211183) TaxID=1391915 RepID=U7Q4S1_SPOS1|nr:hypothetical protein HMPREF1624_00005 [Sporothrix schenckii ATCC 58251]
MKTTSLSTFAVLASLAAANFEFRSRPEFAIPHLNITTTGKPGSLERGLLFVGQYPGFTTGPDNVAFGPIQPAAYIFQDDGELVWSGVGYHAGWVANFAPVIWKGEPYLRAFQGALDPVHGRMFGFHSLLDKHYRPAKVLQSGGHRWASAHEFNIIDEKTALIEIPLPVVASLKPWGGDESQVWVLSSGFQEIDIETGEVVFEWHSFDHVDPKRSAFPLDTKTNIFGSGRSESDAWNYFHVNSVDKDGDGNYLVSARNMASVYKLNGTNGHVLWQLGGLHGGADFEFENPENDVFGYQHHARFCGRSTDGSIEYISLFDNGAHSADVKTHPTSRARVYKLDYNTGRATAIRSYEAPDGLSASTQGSTQILPNGHVFVNWGQAGAITEYAEDGKVLFHAYLDSDPAGHLVQSYRGFRANWTGIPAEEPALAVYVSDSANKEGIDAYVSWNGDTETKVWRFYVALDGRFLGEVKRSGFETHAFFKNVASVPFLDGVKIYAEAIDGDGNVLRQAKPVFVQRNVRANVAHEYQAVDQVGL